MIANNYSELQIIETQNARIKIFDLADNFTNPVSIKEKYY